MSCFLRLKYWTNAVLWHCLKVTVYVRWRTVTGVMLLLHPRAIQAPFTCRVSVCLRYLSCCLVFFFLKSCGVLLCAAPKNEDAYEISIPYEENSFEQQGFFNQSDQNFDGECQIKFKEVTVLWHSLLILLVCSMFSDFSDCTCRPQRHPQMLAHPQWTTHTWWSPTCGPSSRSLWRKTPGCRKESKTWKRRGTSFDASWIDSFFPQRARDKSPVRASTVMVRAGGLRPVDNMSNSAACLKILSNKVFPKMENKLFSLCWPLARVRIKTIYLEGKKRRWSSYR